MTERPIPYLVRFLVALPLLSLALGALGWLRYGTDMPWYDDWRGYADGTIDSLALSYLFTPVNDTLAPVGFALDALAQRLLGGNAVAYQFLSMVTVLGSLLLLQWKLLRRALDNTLHAAVCFMFTLLMLQPGSYWGLDNLAYHQALPLVFILGALLLMSGPSRGAAWRGPVLALLAWLAGFTYISGAFAAFAAGIAALVVARLCHVGWARRQLLREGTWFTAASALAVAAQSYFSLYKLRGTHAGVPLALPHEGQFWAYYLGKLARSLLLPASWPLTSVAVALIACLVALVAAVLLLRRASSQSGTDREKQVAAVYLPLGAVVVVYLMLVAAGRAHLRPPDVQGLLQVFVYGFLRFHFFWAALVWPWAIAALIAVWQRQPGRGEAGPRWAAAFAGASALLIFQAGGFAHIAKMRQEGANRTTVANCLLRELQKGGAVRCEWLLPPRNGEAVPDSFPSYLYARKIGATFVRHFPILPPAPRREANAAFYTMDGGTAKPRTHELELLGQGSFRATGADPQLFIQTQMPQIMRRCMTLDIEVDMSAQTRDTVELFYAPAGESEAYSAQHSVAAAVGPGSLQTLSFRLSSDSGFFESLRLDPVTRPQTVEIRGVRLYCVWELP